LSTGEYGNSKNMPLNVALQKELRPQPLRSRETKTVLITRMAQSRATRASEDLFPPV
jgi:hypothetical protein